MYRTSPTAIEILPPPLAPRVEAQLDALEDARDIVSRFMRRMDDIAATMPAEELKVALVEKGQMILNVTRAGRALRQIVAMEQEVMGLREPPTAHGGGPHGNGPGGQGSGVQGPGSRPGRHDFNDLNDLNEAQDLQDFEALFDLDNPQGLKDWDDLEVLERYDDFEKYRWHRKHGLDFTEEDEEELDKRIEAILEKYKDSPRVSDEQRRLNIIAQNAWLKAEGEKIEQADKEQWQQRRAALVKLRKTQKALARQGRGPPLAWTYPTPGALVPAPYEKPPPYQEENPWA